MAQFGNKSVSSEDISQARGDEVERLIPDSSPQNEEDDDFFLRGPSKKVVRFTTEKFKDVQVQISEVTDVMRSNVGRLMERGDRLDDLQERSGDLSATSDQFRVSAAQMQRKFWWRNVRANAWLALIVLVLALLVVIPIIVKFAS